MSKAAVIGVPDERWGKRPMALGVVSKWAVPGRVRTLPALDKTSVGNPDKKLMRQKYA